MPQNNLYNDNSGTPEGGFDFPSSPEEGAAMMRLTEEGMKLYGLNLKVDAVNHPSHYTAGKIECIDALEAATVGLSGIEAVCTANAIKYLWRWKHKNGAEDLKKAQWYINRLIERTEKD